MLELPLESMPVWTGLVTAAFPAVGLALRARTAPPDAASLARTVDSVAASPSDARAEHPLDADEIRVERRRLRLRTDGTTTGAPLACSGVVPALDHGALAAVLRGRPPATVFADESAFAAALADAQTRDCWRPAPDCVCVRRISWGDVDVTLVGG